MRSTIWKTLHVVFKITGENTPQSVTLEMAQRNGGETGADGIDSARIVAFMIPDPAAADIQLDEAPWTNTGVVAVDTVCETQTPLSHSFTPPTPGDYVWLANGYHQEGPGSSSCGGLYAYDETGSSQQRSVESFISGAVYVPLTHFQVSSLDAVSNRFRIRHRPDANILNGSRRRGLIMVLFRADVFDSVEFASDVTATTTIDTAYQTKLTLTTATVSAPADHVYLAVMGMDHSVNDTNLATLGQIRLDGTAQLEEQVAMARSSSDRMMAWAWAETSAGGRTIDAVYAAETGQTTEAVGTHIISIRYVEPVVTLQ